MAVAIAVRVRFFARLRELTGSELENVTAPAHAKVFDIYQAMRVVHTSLPSYKEVRAAVNQEFADWQDPVADGDEVAFIPPVSGGAA